MEFHNPFLMKGSVWRGINTCGLLITWSIFALGTLSFFLNVFTWGKRTTEHIKEATLLNTPTSWNISILWFFFKAERCSYGGRNPYQHWLDRLITLEAILSLLVMGHQIACKQNKKRSKAYCYQTVKEQDRPVASTSDKRTAEKKKKNRKCYKITQNNTEVLSFFLLYLSKVSAAGTFHL